MLERYPQPNNWYRVRFRDEVLFGYGSLDKLNITPKLDSRYCQDCIHEPAEKDKKRYHCWAIVWHNFNSKIYFYKVLGNTNGKINQQVYIN